MGSMKMKQNQHNKITRSICRSKGRRTSSHHTKFSILATPQIKYTQIASDPDFLFFKFSSYIIYQIQAKQSDAVHQHHPRSNTLKLQKTQIFFPQNYVYIINQIELKQSEEKYQSGGDRYWEHRPDSLPRPSGDLPENVLNKPDEKVQAPIFVVLVVSFIISIVFVESAATPPARPRHQAAFLGKISDAAIFNGSFSLSANQKAENFSLLISN